MSRLGHRDKKLISGCLGLEREGFERKFGVTVNGYAVSFGGDESVLKLIVVLVAQLCEYTKNHSILHFKSVNCMACELYFNIAVILKSHKKIEV